MWILSTNYFWEGNLKAKFTFFPLNSPFSVCQYSCNVALIEHRELFPSPQKQALPQPAVAWTKITSYLPVICPEHTLGWSKEVHRLWHHWTHPHDPRRNLPLDQKIPPLASPVSTHKCFPRPAQLSASTLWVGCSPQSHTANTATSSPPPMYFFWLPSPCVEEWGYRLSTSAGERGEFTKYTICS